jgi:hypothetical protein
VFPVRARAEGSQRAHGTSLDLRHGGPPAEKSGDPGAATPGG